MTADGLLVMVQAFLILVFGFMAMCGLARLLAGHKTALVPLLLGAAVVVLVLVV